MSQIATFTVVLRNAAGVASPATEVSHVHYADQPGTAVAGTDYTATSGILTFNVGDSSQTITVPILADTTANVDKSFHMVLTTPDGASLGTDTSGLFVISTAATSTPTVSIDTPSGVTVGNTFTATGTASGMTTIYLALTLAGTTGDRVSATVSNGSFSVPFTPTSMGSATLSAYAAATGGTAIATSSTFNVGAADSGALTIGISHAEIATTPAPTALKAVHAVGNQFVDSAGNKIWLRGVNWYGFDGPDLMVHGLYAGRDYKDMIDQMRELGFNLFRLPLSDDILTSTATFNGDSGNQFVAPIQNPDLLGLTIMEGFDKIIAYCASVGMYVLLDQHRISMNSTGPDDSGFGTDGWPAADLSTATYLYGGSTTPQPYTEQTWQAFWSALSTHCTTGAYATDPTLKNVIVGFEPHNEPYHPTWDTWAGMCERLLPVVNAIAPTWMMFVNGVGSSDDGTDKGWEGGYLKGVATRPINVGALQSLVAYSAHDYGVTVFAQDWLASVAQASPPTGYPVLGDNMPAGWPDNLEAHFQSMWGFIYEQNIAPVCVDEFGFGGGYDYSTGGTDPNQLPANAAYELQWITALGRYILGMKNDGTSIILQPGDQPLSFAFFSLNPENGNPLGGLLLNSDFTSVQTGKMDVLLPLVQNAPMPANYAKFTVALSHAATVDVTALYGTYDDNGTHYADYTTRSGTITIPAGATTAEVDVPVRADPAAPSAKRFGLRLSNPTGDAALSSTPELLVTVGGGPAYSAVPFPGYRSALLGDSITYMNHHWNPAIAVQGSSPEVDRYEFYGTGVTGWFTWLNMLRNQTLELEASLQPNTNPGQDSTAPNNGYNFAIYSSQVAQLNSPDFDPLAGANLGLPVAHNVGPLYNAMQYIDKFDLAFILDGTNDLSGGLPWEGVLTGLQSAALQLAQAGKWVFVLTIFPRTADLLQAVNGVGGYPQDQVVSIIQGLMSVNQGLRDWIANVQPPNIWLIDPWDEMVGPQSSLIPGTPTDPSGMLSPASGIVSGQLIPSTVGNFRPEAPNARFCFDGLHTAPPGAYACAKVATQVLTAAGVPLPARNSTAFGPLTIGPNMMANTNFAVTNTTDGSIAGRAIGLGAPLNLPASTDDSSDQYANQGQGYTHGVVPDRWFFYRESNNDSESYSNFNEYTFSSFTSVGPDNAEPVPAGYLVDSTWADGAVTTRVVTVDGQPGWEITVNIPAGLTQNEGFVLRYQIAEGQHGPWDGWGYATGDGSQTVTAPAPPYSAGDTLIADCDVKFSGLSGKFQTFRCMLNFLSINSASVGNNDYSSTGAVISGIGCVESYFPFTSIGVVTQHPEDKQVTFRSASVKAPTPASGEDQQYAQLNLQLSWDCSDEPATAVITVLQPRIAKLTGPAL